jgi:hypothetical protein
LSNKGAYPMRSLIIALAASAALASPAFANRGPAPQDDRNSHWLDYKTDLSEAKRELASDLRRAKKPSDRAEAEAEYQREVADARSDYTKEMIEKGYRMGTVEVLDDDGD